MSEKSDDSDWLQQQESKQQKQDSNLIKQTDQKNKNVNTISNLQNSKNINLNDSHVSSSSSDWLGQQKTGENKDSEKQIDAIPQKCNDKPRGDKREDIKNYTKPDKKQYITKSWSKNRYLHNNRKINYHAIKQSVINQYQQQTFNDNVQVQILNPKISQYSFTICYKDVIVQVIQCSPQNMNKHFDCIALPFLNFNSRNNLISLLHPQLTIGEKSKDITTQIRQEIQRGSFGVSQAYFMSRIWFKDSPYQWRKGVLGRIPKNGDFDDKKLLITTIQRILSFYQNNLFNDQQNGSIMMSWIAQTFSLKDGSQLHIQGIFKYIQKSKNSKIKRIAIGVENSQQLNDLKQKLRKKLIMLSYPQKA